MGSPTTEELQSALSKAGSAHHDYETNYLKGVRDEQWGGWYWAYVLGHLGDFTSPSALTALLEQVQSDGDWAEAAAQHVFANI